MKNINITKFFLKRYIAYIFAFVIIIIISSVMLFATKHGVGVSPDSIVYIDTAKHITETQSINYTNAHGKIVPMTHYPPLYPLVLSVFSLAELEPVQSAKILNILIFIYLILFIFYVLYKLTSSLTLSIVGALLVLTSQSILHIHLMAWTEPLFIAVAITGIYFLFLYFEKEKRMLLTVSSLLFSAAILIRYFGISFAFGGLLALFIFQGKKNFFNVLQDAAQFFIISFLPLTFWMTRNFILTGSLTNRQIEFHPATIKHVHGLFQTFTLWISNLNFGNFFNFIVFLVFVLLIGSGIIYINKNSNLIKSNDLYLKIKKIIYLLIVCTFSYITLLYFSISFADFHTPVNFRILSPIYIPIMLTLILVVHLINIIKKRNYVFYLVVAFAFIYSVLSFTACLNYAIAGNENGISLSSLAWKNSKIIKYSKTIPTSKPIFSNAYDAVYLHTNRVVTILPAISNPLNKKLNENYLQDVQKMRETLINQDGFLVYFHGINWRRYLISEDELLQLLDLQLIKEFPSGNVYKIK